MYKGLISYSETEMFSLGENRLQLMYKIQSSQVSSPRTNLRILHGPMDSPSFPLIPLSLKAQGSGVRKKNEPGSSHVAKGLVRGESVTFPGLDKGRFCFF